MERSTSLVHLLLISLALSHLIASCYAVPSTRPGRMLRLTRAHLVIDDVVQIINESRLLEDAKSQRMIIEINDYPPLSANDRHTPKPPE